MNPHCQAGTSCQLCRDDSQTPHGERGQLFRVALSAAFPECAANRLHQGKLTSCAYGVTPLRWQEPKWKTPAAPKPAWPGSAEQAASTAALDSAIIPPASPRRQFRCRRPCHEIWRVIHTCANPDQQFIAWIRRQISGCGGCLSHFNAMLQVLPPALDSLENWRRRTVEWHNHVNKNRGVPVWTMEQAAQRWGWNATSPAVTAIASGSGNQSATEPIDFFDRVVLVNLDRRPERLERALAALRDASWPFREPQRFAAVDGRARALPTAWRPTGPGAFGCMMSHRAVLGAAIADGIQSMLVLEDDLCLAKDFAAKVAQFLARVPDDWDGLMFGGQHMSRPTTVFRGSGSEISVVRCANAQRTHAYAVRGKWMLDLHAAWEKYVGHCDHRMGAMERDYKIYAPAPWLVGQDSGRSDITGHQDVQRWW